ncbi:hypothetical protein BAE44_0021019 [Dichanthelium oligosanthes]|uniref:Uncharacterized protein n=1 Tax=Dichanthelium oligosanthes TaxID=888268 RepID=A0A1E5UYW4_9POAL|nr:hypothetical protein BAE44_0021019 [Dichanthelium oligosanthes]
MAGGKSGGSSDAASLALRIATVALSVASASQRSCAGCAPASQVSYSDYSSLKYSFVANIISAALQAAAAAWMTARGRDGEAKAAKSLAELVDTAA